MSYGAAAIPGRRVSVHTVAEMLGADDATPRE
jgi:uncharacterized protein (DUF433 family)